jgi:hypothetical protein
MARVMMMMMYVCVVEIAMQVSAGMQAGRQAAGHCWWCSSRMLGKFGAWMEKLKEA